MTCSLSLHYYERSLLRTIIYFHHTIGLSLNGSFRFNDLAVRSLGNDFSFIFQSNIFISVEWSESPFSRNNNLLSSWELHLGSSESFDGVGNVLLVGTDRKEDLSDTYSDDETVWLSVGVSHTGLESIGSGTG